MFSILKNQVNVSDIVNKSSESFFNHIPTKVEKKNSSSCSRQESLHDMQKSTDQLQYLKKFYLTFITI